MHSGRLVSSALPFSDVHLLRAPKVNGLTVGRLSVATLVGRPAGHLAAICFSGVR